MTLIWQFQVLSGINRVYRALPSDYLPCKFRSERIAAIGKELATGKYDVVLLQEVQFFQLLKFKGSSEINAVSL